MESGEGMIAVVRGLRDSALAVTLLDGGRHYTLQPDVPPKLHVSNAASCQCSTDVVRTESAVQATDGRYASTYKMMHCHVMPTAPHTEVTEFPPQRAELCPGHGNFEIGGPGSCEKYRATKSSNYKGGMCWPDKGAVFTSRPSVQPDAFATSLRKYPNMSPERSTEIMERLISFAQNRSVTSKVKSPSPTRNIESDSSTFCLEAFRNTNAKSQKNQEPDINLKNRRIEESPTRERSMRPADSEVESWRRSTFCKTTDVRFLKDVTRAVREGIRSMAANNQPEKLPRHNNNSPSPERRAHAQKSCNSVNMEIQAAVQMVSREVVTSPKNIPSQRNVAVSITPPTSAPVRSSGGVSFKTADINQDSSSKSIQTKHTSIDVQAIISSNDIRKRTRRNNRRSKSDEEITFERNNNVHVIEQDYQRIDKHKARCCCKSRHNKFKNTFPKRIDQVHNVDSLDDFDSYHLKSYPDYSHVLHTKITPYRAIDEDDLAEVLEDWLSIIPIKPVDYFGRPIENEYLFYELFERLKNTAYHLPEHNRRDKIKEDIIRLLNEFPVDVKGNRNTFLNKLADILIEKIKNLGRNVRNKRTQNKNKFNSFFDFARNRYIPPTESELRTFISDEIITFIRKFGLTFYRRALLELEEELVDIITVFMENIHTSNADLFGADIVNILIDYGFLDHQASHFVHILIKHLREAFLDESNIIGRVKSETLVVLPSLQSPNPYTSVKKNPTEYSISAINESDLNAMMEIYTRQLCEQINDWLTSIQTLLPRINERGFRQVVVNDLAGDIIDRHKYLEINPGSRGTDEAELEHLKYQIFKWINKLAGEDTLQPGEHAPELMRRIRGIPVPMLSKPSSTQPKTGNISNMQTIEPFLGSTNSTYQDNTIQNPATKETSKIACSQSRSCGKESCSQNKNHGPCCPEENLVIPTTPSTEQLNEDYEEFLKNWVQKIPIRSSSPEEEGLVEKARLGIHNGIWKAITKIRCDQSIFTNRFYFEDVFDDEIEELLNCLPQTPELQAKKHLLKVELIKRTVDTLEHNKTELARSFKHQLLQNVDNSLQRQGLQMGTDSYAKSQLELEIMRIVEQFVLYSNYKDEDNLKSEVYRNRLLKEIKKLIDEIKKHHDQDQTNVNYAMYITDILNALHQVPLPSDDTIKEEAYNILLEFEIEKWFTDLPITLNEDNNIEILQWKRKLDNLAQKVRDLENNLTSNDTRERSIRNEILKFLERAPLQGENININFMVEQLVNRIKNRDRVNITKRVVFHEPGSYDAFRSNLPLSSSYIEKPRPTSGTDAHSKTQDSLALTNENRSLGGSEVDYGAFTQERPKSSTLKENAQKTLATIQDDSQDRDESEISYQGFSGRRPVSSTFKNKPDDTTQNDSFGGNASELNYDKFAGKIPVSSSFKNKEDSFITIPHATARNVRDTSIGEYRDFAEEGPISSTFKEQPNQKWNTLHDSKDEKALKPTSGTPHSFSQSRQERQSSDPYKSPKSTPKPTKKTYERDAVDDSVQITSEKASPVPACCKPQSALGTKDRLSPEAGSSGLQRLETPQPVRFQKGSYGASKGIIFKDTDDFTATPKLPSDNRYAEMSNVRTCSTECQTVRQAGAQGEVGDIQISQDGSYRTIGTNTTKKRTQCLGDDIGKLLDIDNYEDGEIRCRCIERFLRCKRQIRRFACDGLDMDLPSCLPLMYTCPCFL